MQAANRRHRQREDVPGLMALYPLSRHDGTATQAVTHAAEVIAVREADSIVRADLLTTLGIFGKLAYPDLDVVQQLVHLGEMGPQRARSLARHGRIAA